VAQFEADPNRVCYVNPDNPSEAVLKRGFHAKLLLALLPLLFLLIGVGGLIGTWRGRPALASRGHLGLAWPDRDALTGSKVQGQDALATAAGRAILKPSLSAKAKFVGMTIVALFWNGIISIFVVNVVNDFRHSDPSWLGMLFLLPFIAIGVGLIGGALYQFLALFNPRPTLELSSRIVPLGGAAQLNWGFSGHTSRIHEFTVTLRGIEEARYRRGTSTYTDKNTFHEMEIYRTSHPSEIASGQVGFVLPQDTMHSFEAENNKILWSLDIHGQIQGWPDVKESFKITVTPTVG
jgi:hypothetical protein